MCFYSSSCSCSCCFSPHLCVGFLFTPSFTTPSFTHSFVTHHLLPHHLSHTTLSHTIFCHTIFHTQLCHTPSFATPSFAHHFVTHHLSHTQLCHTLSFTHTRAPPSFTHNFVTHTHTIFLCHTPSFTYNLFYFSILHLLLCLSFLPRPRYNICCSLLEEVDLWGPDGLGLRNCKNASKRHLRKRCGTGKMNGDCIVMWVQVSLARPPWRGRRILYTYL